MNLEELGYPEHLEDFRKSNNLSGFKVARVTAAHRERYAVKSPEGEYNGELLGNLRFSAKSGNDLPAVGDWVAITEYDEGKALIHAIFPRSTILERQAVGKYGEKQIIAANIDYGLIVQSVNRDFNLNRLERYLTICHASGIEPIIIISKVDLAEEKELSEILQSIKTRVKGVPILPVSNETQLGIDELKKHIIKGKTYCLLGSSGVGKSSLINSLSGEYLVKTGSISEAIDRGKHVTTHRELFLLFNGAFLIDNPGMREVGITEISGGLEQTFEIIYHLAKQCKFSDCSHTSEKGCAVLNALSNGEITSQELENFHKMESEHAHFSATVKERRSKDKAQGKMYREVMRLKKKNKY